VPAGPPRTLANDTRPFAIVINTAPNAFLLIGANGAPKFTADSPGPASVAIAGKEEGRYEQGQWIRVRRLNGDEITTVAQHPNWPDENQPSSLRLI
jgi:hypothetical protein